jgi:hypothetical protein
MGHNPPRSACQVTNRKVQVTKWRHEVSAPMLSIASYLIKSGAPDDARCYSVYGQMWAAARELVELPFQQLSGSSPRAQLAAILGLHQPN